jgi:hypothetical protein
VPGYEHADRDADRVDGDVQRRSMAPGDEVLVELVRHRVGDADDERGGLAP